MGEEGRTARCGETRDALQVHLPSSGVMFTGDALMPFLGAPFPPEGSAEGLFDTINLIQRVSPRLLVHGHTPLTEQSYWKPDGEGMEVVSADEWAAAVALLGDDRVEPFVNSARTLLDQHDDALARRLIELGLRRFPDSSELVQLRQQALQRLRALNQQLHPFKFIVYSEWAQSELAPIDSIDGPEHAL